MAFDPNWQKKASRRHKPREKKSSSGQPVRSLTPGSGFDEEKLSEEYSDTESFDSGGSGSEENESDDGNSSFSDLGEQEKQKGKGAIKWVKHKTSEIKQNITRWLGIKTKKVLSSDQLHQSLTASVGSNIEVKGEHGNARKAAVGAGKLVIGNFIESGASLQKAKNVGEVKSKIQNEQYTIREDEYNDFMMMANTLRGTFKRQALWNATVGTFKQALGIGAAFLTGAPGSAELIGSGFEKIGTKIGSTVLSAGASAGGERLAPKARVVGGGAPKLDSDGWQDMLIKYLNHKDSKVQNFMKEMIRSLFLEDIKGDQLIAIAELNPLEAAKLICARQQGASEYKYAITRYRKAHSGE